MGYSDRQWSFGCVYLQILCRQEKKKTDDETTSDEQSDSTKR